MYLRNGPHHCALSPQDDQEAQRVGAAVPRAYRNQPLCLTQYAPGRCGKGWFQVSGVLGKGSPCWPLEALQPRCQALPCASLLFIHWISFPSSSSSQLSK